MITQFKKIKDFEGLYEIDNDGNVKSLINDIILKPSILKNGYKKVVLCKDGKHYNKLVHRLVAETFLPNPNNHPQVNHKKEFEKANNHVELMLDGNGNVVVDYEKTNLEWCTQKYNVNYGTRNERIAEKQRGKQISEEARAKMIGRKLSEEAKIKLSIKHRGVPKPKVAEALRGRKLSEEVKRKISSTLTNGKTSKPVVAVKDGNVVYEFPSVAEAGRSLGINHANVSLCCLGKRKTCGGYEWYFKDEWLQMQKENAAPHKRETAYQLEIQFD